MSLKDVVLVWHVDRAYQDSELWHQLIADEWEPFAVTMGSEGFLYHLKKLVPVWGSDPWTPIGPTA